MEGYYVAGIDVHKTMLVVVVTEVKVGEWSLKGGDSVPHAANCGNWRNGWKN
jgi:hypothetical protein